MDNPAARLVEGFGGRSATAAKFNVSVEAVRLWLRDGIPADRALEVEEAAQGFETPVTATEVLQYAKAQREAA